MRGVVVAGSFVVLFFAAPAWACSFPPFDVVQPTAELATRELSDLRLVQLVRGSASCGSPGTCNDLGQISVAEDVSAGAAPVAVTFSATGTLPTSLSLPEGIIRLAGPFTLPWVDGASALQEAFDFTLRLDQQGPNGPTGVFKTLHLADPGRADAACPTLDGGTPADAGPSGTDAGPDTAADPEDRGCASAGLTGVALLALLFARRRR